MREKIAIVGGGIAGLTAAYFLSRKYDITLFEKKNRLGGNAYTLTTDDGLSFDVAVAVFGKNCYPNFTKLLKQLNIETTRFSSPGIGMRNLETKKEFTFSFGLKGLWAQRFSILKPKQLFSIFAEFINMNRLRKLYEQGALEGLTMKESFELHAHKSDARVMSMFMLCTVSSMYYEEIMDAPADFFFGKMAAHKDFFSPRAIFSMFQAKHNTQSYVDALVDKFKDKVILNASIASIERQDDGCLLKHQNGSVKRFDKVVMACNADQALALLDAPSEDEKRILGAWIYKEGPIVVHKDMSSLPEKERHNLYTFLFTNKENEIHTSITGHIRRLKNVSNDCEYLSTQHPNFPIDEKLIEFHEIFRTPVFDTNSVQVIEELPSLNGKKNTYYCGSHFGYGLHEDAVTSAIDVAEMLDAGWA